MVFQNELYISFHSHTKTMVLLTVCRFVHFMLQTNSGNGNGRVFWNNRQTGLFPQEQPKESIQSGS